MKSLIVVILPLVVLICQGGCVTDDGDSSMDAGQWTDALNGVIPAQRPDISDICRFLLRENEIDPSQVDRSNVNLYRSLYLLMAYINEDGLLKQVERRCREQQPDAEEIVYKRSEGEKVVGKKQKFHSWGGKRTGNGGDMVIPNPVYRAKFHSWGGKRSLSAT